MAATGLSRVELITQGTEFLTPDAFDRLQDYSARRLSGEPVDNILGWRAFYGRRFKISHNVLSPRQETEEVTAKALERIADTPKPAILDLGTGSGAIIITLLLERLDASAIAADISGGALEIARANAAAFNIGERAEFIQSNWFENIGGHYDLIISNPPYIDSQAMEALPQDVSKFDPAISLHGGADGLDPYRLIAAQAKGYLKPDGWLVLEIGFDQGMSVPSLLQQNGFKSVELFQDSGGHDRIVTAQI